MWLVGQDTHVWFKVSRWRLDAQAHPVRVAIMLGAQQIFAGPVGAVPVGQTQWRVTVSKSMPAGQQGK